MEMWQIHFELFHLHLRYASKMISKAQLLNELNLLQVFVKPENL